MPTIVAIAIVADSSVTLGTEWHQMLKDYFGPLLQRINEGNTVQFRFAFVSYGPADSHDSPVLATRFFGPAQPFTKELREDSTGLGIGRTGSGGSLGMAALEGYAAVIEMFDLLNNDADLKPLRPLSLNQPSEQDPNSYILHLWHFAAADPDTAERPLWNNSPILDDLSWATVPDELRKRNIHCSMFLTRPSPRFSEIFNLITSGARIQPWFNTRPRHTLLLSGLPPPHTKGATVPVKRAVETPTADRSPGPKRARVTPSQTSSPAMPSVKSNAPVNSPIPPAAVPPSLSSSAITTQPEPPTLVESPSKTPHVPQPDAPQPQPQANGSPPKQIPLTMAQIQERMQHLEASIPHLGAVLQKAKVNGTSAEDINKMTMVLNQKLNTLKRGRMILMRDKEEQMRRAAAQSGSQGHSQQSGGSNSTTAHANPFNSATPSLPNQASSSTPSTTQQPPSAFGVMADPQTIAQKVQNRVSAGLAQSPLTPSSQDSHSLAPQLKQNIPPAMAAQMQKLVEQRAAAAKVPPNGHGNGAHPSSQPQSSSSSVMQGMGMSNLSSFNSEQSQQAQQPQPQQQQIKTPPVHWRGVLSWTGVDTNSNEKKEVRAEVVATAQPTHGNLMANTWPPMLLLTPSREPAVPLPELEEWLRKHSPAICQLESAPSTLPAHYNQLIHLLKDKNMYALASWNIPGKGRVPTMLIAPFGENGLLAAVFPTTGIPDYPKPKNPTMSYAALLSRLPEQVRNLPLEQRNSLVMQLLHKRQQSMQQPNPMSMANMQTMAPNAQQQLQFQQKQMAQQQLQSQQQPQQGNSLMINGKPGEMNPFLPQTQASLISSGFLNVSGQQAGQAHLMQQQQSQANMLGLGHGGMSMGGLGGMMGGLANPGMPNLPNGAGGLTMGAGAGGQAMGGGNMNPTQGTGLGSNGVTWDMFNQWMQRSDGTGGAGLRQGPG
ncbi:hypothetical protein BV25DRAFT_1993731 [Artomyces pyxidatus]|uniref:Uncharacterized protein n=1 Tax=Artomyces pyxidatus TaxID=48021 RepID=A0ACB8STD1_9AGAM|nr:hypothetical protein BV25DRAFT_1993731 [Artomyces pyxidatus]